MNEFQVFFRPRARKDLLALYRYIAQHASPSIAGNYIQRIEEACLSLAALPTRGSAVRGRRPGLRTMGFERRATILFQVGEKRVEILRIFYGGRNLEPQIPKP